MLGLRFLRAEFYLLQHSKHDKPIIDKKTCAWKMQSLRFLREEFFFLQCSKHAPPIIE